MPKLAEYFDSDKFESSASRIWKIDHFSRDTKWNTSLFFVPESDISHFHFNFELRRSSNGVTTINVTRERSLIQDDLINKRKDAQLMIQLLLLDSNDQQINLKSLVFFNIKTILFIEIFNFLEFVLNLFEKSRNLYDQFNKQITIDSSYLADANILSNDLLKIRIGVSLI